MRTAGFVLAACVLATLGACAAPTGGGLRRDARLEFVRPDASVAHALHVQIADTEQARERGLMHRRDLGVDEGMLFIYPAGAERSFWMKDTPLSLDIAFVGADGRVLNIVRHTTPGSTRSVRSAGPARYVVEMLAGTADARGLEPGMSVTWR